VLGVATRARRLVPKVGMLTILMNDYPKLKYALIGTLALVVFLSNDM
jgi:signal peptidase